MPVEIKELIIRTIVAAKEKPEGDEYTSEIDLVSNQVSNTDSIVQECVRQVMRIINKNKER